MYLLILLFPLLGSLLAGGCGRSLGFRGAAVISTSCVAASFILSVVAFYEVALSQSSCFIQFAPWFQSEMFDATWGFYFDSLTVVMLVVITSISLLVHVYSISYMSGDPHIPRFMSYLSIFTFFMIMLVTADNLIQMFFGWEGVGLASYLLINFWFTRLQASKASIKAMLMNRVGDFGLALGIMGLFFLFKTSQFSIIFACAPAFAQTDFIFCNIEWDSLSLIAAFLFIGAIGKSAQLGLHTWLPDAMEGPTPVSALIHAATMVTAGVFLLARCSPLFEFAPTSLMIVTFVGAMTCFFAATTGIVQNDLKRVIAYSTCSQLGYMVFACGISNYSAGVFHLMNHAFFKALLFLSAGSVIHALSDEQDMRKMGGTIQLIPFTYSMMCIGSLSLTGFPFLTGFYSKDAILELAYANYTISGNFAYWLGAVSVFFTSYYSFRLLNLTFFAPTALSRETVKKVHDAPFIMGFPLFLLALGSIFVGYLAKDMMIGVGTSFWNNALFVLPNNVQMYEAEFIPQSQKFIPLFATLGGALIAFLQKKNPILSKGAPLHERYSMFTRFAYYLYAFLNKRWLFDKIYSEFIAQKALYFGYWTSFKTLDKGSFEILGPYGISKTMQQISQYFRGLQTGLLYHYAVIMLIGSTFFITVIGMWEFIEIYIDNRLYFIFFLSFLFYNFHDS